jgi:DNA-binding NtrC family response regulator
MNQTTRSPLPEPAGDPVEASFDSIGRTIVDRVPEPKNGGEPFDVFAEVERAVVSAALTRTGGNKQAAANLLGIYRPRLYSMIKRHKLGSSEGTSDPKSGIQAEQSSEDVGDDPAA